jgi:hypothetical protein
MASLPGTYSTDYSPLPITAISQTRRTTVFIPQNGAQSYAVTEGTRIYIQISGADLIDPQASFLEFQLQVSAPGAIGGSEVCGGILLPNSAESYIQRLVITAGSELERVEFYNVAETALNQIFNNSDVVDGVGRATMGLTRPEGPLDERFIPFTTTAGTLGWNNRFYQIPLQGSGLFGSNRRLIPARWITQNRALQIEITLADFASQCLIVAPEDSFTAGVAEAAGSSSKIPARAAGSIPTPSATVIKGKGAAGPPSVAAATTPTSLSAVLNSVRFVCDVLSTGSESSISASLAEGRVLAYPITKLTWYGTQIPVGSSSFNWSISHSASDITGLLVCFTAPIVDTDTLGDKIANPIDTLVYPNFAQDGFYCKIGTAVFPQVPMRFQSSMSADTDVTGALYSAPHAFNEMSRFAYYAPARVGAAVNGFNWGRNNWRSNPANPGGALTTSGAAAAPDDTAVTNFAVGSAPESAFMLAMNFDADLTEEVAGAGLNLQSAGFTTINLTLLFNSPLEAWNPTTQKFGGPLSMHMWVRNRANVLVSATGVSLSTDLLNEASLGGPVL